MYPSPCDRTCSLSEDKNGRKRCIGCLRIPSELQWDALSNEQQEQILNRDHNTFFEAIPDGVSNESYPSE